MKSWLVDDSEYAFDEIWRIHPELQNTGSSAWWFFLLLPEQESGYGPRQMMFSYASRAGQLIAVRDKWQKGFDVDTVEQQDKAEAEFMTTVVGWINDGDQVHEEIVHQGVLAHLSGAEGYLRAFNEVDGKSLGAEIKISEDKELGIDADFRGERGYARFTVWSDPEDKEHLPQITDINPKFVGRFFNVHLVAWRKVNFRGVFKSPAKVEELQGIGYFQRVLFNGPLLPWIWVWTVFEDKSVFSTFIPYFGVHNARRADRHFTDFFENRLLKIAPSAYFIWESQPEMKETKFDQVSLRIENQVKDLYDNLPVVKLRVANDTGDYLNIVVRAHGHAQFHLDRAVLKQFWMSRWNYNEFMVHIDHISGKINGKSISTNQEDIGEGWGNMEYTWGMSL